MFDLTAPIPCNSPLPLTYNADDLNSPRGRWPLTGRGAHRTCSAALPDTSIDVLIVGGGIHGTGMLVHLSRDIGLRVRVLSGQPQLASEFLNRLDNLGQTVLRSGYEHHLGPDGALQLIDYAKLHADELTGAERRQVELHLTSCRSIVPVDVFEGHLNYLCAAFQLGKLAVNGWVKKVERGRTARYSVRLSSGARIEAQTIVLATGATERVAARSEVRRPVILEAPALVVGGGLSAAHRVLELLRKGRQVSWAVRRTPRFQCSDISHKYFRTEGIRAFGALSSAGRVEVLTAELRSSVMPEFRTPLAEAAANGRLAIHVGDHFEPSADDIHRFPGYAFDRAVHETLCDGLGPLGPLIDETLEYECQPGIFACGWAALGAVGPAAKNIDGVRHCAERILSALGIRGRSPQNLPFHRSTCLGSLGVGKQAAMRERT